MNRKDANLDAMLRYLGAAYYDSLQGKAALADVTRALDSVAEYVGVNHHGLGHSRVRDVMTTSVVTVGRMAPYKEIVGLLAEHKISGVPVLTMDRHVAGVVSEGDLLAARGGAAAAQGAVGGSRGGATGPGEPPGGAGCPPPPSRSSRTRRSRPRPG